MNEKIETILGELEKKHDCRILAAVDGGSRAWGVASPDSGYDVRAVYVRAADWYLRLDENPPEDWSATFPDALGVVAWDMRKAFRGILQGDPAFLEWLGSPVVYRDMGLEGEVGKLLPQVFDAAKAVRHYAEEFHRAAEDRAPDGTISLRELCRALRANAAVRWILRNGTMPPTEFWPTLDGAGIADETRRAVDELAAVKAATGEGERIVPKVALLPLLFVREEEIRAFEPPAPNPRELATAKDGLERIFFARALAIMRRVR